VLFSLLTAREFLFEELLDVGHAPVKAVIAMMMPWVSSNSRDLCSILEAASLSSGVTACLTKQWHVMSNIFLYRIGVSGSDELLLLVRVLGITHSLEDFFSHSHDRADTDLI
jgi:hypothetical protein